MNQKVPGPVVVRRCYLAILLILATTSPSFFVQSFSLRRRGFLSTAVVTTTTAMAKTTSSESSPKEGLSTIKWGIVGLGDVTEKKSGPPFWKCTGSELVAVMRRTPGKAQEFAQKVPVGSSGTKCVGYDNLEDFLKHPGLQAVYVCTRPGTHLEIGRRVAEAGKALYVEKPVGRCAAETQALYDLFRDKDIPFYTAYISRAYDRTQMVKRLLEEGTVGDKITNISYELVGSGGARDMNGPLPWRLDPVQSGGGLIMDVGCHVLDRIDYLCGPLVEVQGVAENRNSPDISVEDYVRISAIVGTTSKDSSYAVGATVECSWDFGSSANPKDELVFRGSKGSIHLAGMSPNAPIEVRSNEGTTLQSFTFDMPEHTAQKLIQAVTDSLRGLKRKDFVSGGANAVRTSKVIDTALACYYGHREMGYWEDVNSES